MVSKGKFLRKVEGQEYRYLIQMDNGDNRIFAGKYQDAMLHQWWEHDNQKTGVAVFCYPATKAEYEADLNNRVSKSQELSSELTEMFEGLRAAAAEGANRGKMVSLDSFKPAIFPEIKAHILQALQPVAERYNIDISFGNASYDDYLYKPQLILKIKGESGKIVTKDYSDQCVWLPKFGTTFVNRSKKFTVVEHKPNQAYDVIAEADGKRYKFKHGDIEALIKLQSI